jgi:hypothetical protein
MGYHVELAASPARPITWAELSRAARDVGWQVSEDDQDIVLTREGRLLTRLNFSDGEAWVKTPNDEVLEALIDLAARMGLRLRGEEGESYRSLTETYIHPDDRQAHAVANAPSPFLKQRQRRRLVWNIVRVVMLIVVALGFARKAFLDRS